MAVGAGVGVDALALGDADAVGVAEEVGVGPVVGVSVGRPLGVGAGPPVEQVALLMRQEAGSPAVPVAEVTKPTVTDLPGASSLSQLAGFTVTRLPCTVCSPFQSDPIFVPAGSSN
ncbi:hypothetical protein SCYAM73S_01227 [Streptomyces cyaneofuscatus]